MFQGKSYPHYRHILQDQSISFQLLACFPHYVAEEINGTCVDSPGRPAKFDLLRCDTDPSTTGAGGLDIIVPVPIYNSPFLFCYVHQSHIFLDIITWCIDGFSSFGKVVEFMAPSSEDPFKRSAARVTSTTIEQLLPYATMPSTSFEETAIQETTSQVSTLN
ncbi:hypothetical protein C1646_757488 [Rhizophagus diaphanus]|nr:hypothetical protein C1646_757488 [Rhizophagus diaphanus] [Rhizophagus sp. MUCL 43196]